jgi:hypothetical protein
LYFSYHLISGIDIIESSGRLAVKSAGSVPPYLPAPLVVISGDIRSCSKRWPIKNKIEIYNEKVSLKQS